MCPRSHARDLHRGPSVAGRGERVHHPLLLAGLAETVPEDRFGRQVGIYSSFQALGSGLGPIVGGLAADSQWQWAFYGTAVVSFVLALAPPAGEPRVDAEAPRIRPLLTRQMIALGIAFLFAAAGPLGIAVLVGVAARDVLDLSGTTTGIILFGGAMTALVLGPLWGQVLDRFGPRRSGTFAVIVVVGATSSLAFAQSAWSLGIIWAVAGGLVAFLAIVFQSIGATIMPDNRGGALSFLLSFRFIGHALGPIVFIPLIDRSVRGTFLAASALGLVTLVVIATFRDQSTPSLRP